MAKQEKDLRDELMRVLRSPMRREIVRLLLEQDPAAIGPRDSAEALSGPLSNIAYHYRELQKAQMIVCVHTEQVWGSTAHFYRLTPPLRELPLLEMIVGVNR